MRRLALVTTAMSWIVLTWLGLGHAQLWGPPKSNLWPRWAKSSPADTRTIDHRAWDAFLAKYLVTNHPSGINRMNYKAVTDEDKKALEEYVTRLQAIGVSGYNRNQQRAFWINLYNAFTVKLILDHYPVKSIRKIRPSFFALGPWDEKYLEVEGEALTLNDIEHRILRPIWKDNRIHYGVNCASLGCPNLAATAYTGENTDAMLDSLAVEYVNHPRGAQFTRSGELKVSSIYTWFQEDFDNSRIGVLEHLRKYAKGELAPRLAEYDGPINDEYDWDLNEP